jgi:ribulose-5-phosphate 4-epimerase/fuculose-1-phosphate aldolase
MDTRLASVEPTVRRAGGEAEWQARVNLAACYRLTDRYGMSDMIYTHISARVPGTEHFLINPYGLLFSEITASCLIKVDLDGKTLLQPDEALGYPVNHAGFVIHSAIHAARPEAACVMHTHTRAGIAVSAMKCGLLPLSQHAMRFFERLGYHDYEGPAVDLDERARLVADLGPHEAMILRNHGLLTVGQTIEEAFNLMYWLEMSCKTQVDVMACNTEISLPRAETAAKAAHLYHRETRRPFGIHEWQAMLRLLDRDSPGYRD